MYSVTIVALPGNDRYGKNGWCFSTKHTDLDIEGAVPITFYLGYTYPDIESGYYVAAKCNGPLYFNPVQSLEPDYAAAYVEDMKVLQGE